MPRTIERLPEPAEACSRIRALAEPIEPVEVSLCDALGLVLAEPVVADVDAPAFDRASSDGFAVRSADVAAGVWLRVAGLRWSRRRADESIGPGEAIRVRRGDALPAGADAVLLERDARADAEPAIGDARVVEALRSVEAGWGVERRGSLIEAGAELLPSGTRLGASMVGLLASQGCVHPVCHRRVRVAVVAIGDHLVGPGEAPVMHRERNAANPAIVALALRLGAMPHDLRAVPEPDFAPAFERAASAPVVVVLGPSTRPIRRVLRANGVEPVISGVAMRPGGRARSGVIRDDSGRIARHVFQLPLNPTTASIAFAVLVAPLIGRLQGEPADRTSTIEARWEGEHPSTGGRLRVVPVALGFDSEGRRVARSAGLRTRDDLAGLARADGLALLPARRGPWLGGEPVEVVPLDRA